MYVPILKWKQGEYLALERLENDIKDQITPLIEIPPIGWDFEKGCLAKTINEHLSNFGDRLNKKWKTRRCFVDLSLLDQSFRMEDGLHPVEFVFGETRKHGSCAVPVIRFDRDIYYQHAIKNEVKKDGNGLCIRLLFEDIIKSDIEGRIEILALSNGLELSDIDVILDLKAPNFHPLEAFSKALHSAINKLDILKQCRSFTMAATSFPESMGVVKKGNQLIERSEWLLFHEYLSHCKDNDIQPQFGDYAIAHPVLTQQDMRLLRPSASLRYTIDNAWYIEKGVNVRDYGFKQYVDMCRSLVGSGYFLGGDYSEGDNYIHECSINKASTGNLTVWRRIGTNHHITKIVRDLSNSYVT